MSISVEDAERLWQRRNELSADLLHTRDDHREDAVKMFLAVLEEMDNTGAWGAISSESAESYERERLKALRP